MPKVNVGVELPFCVAPAPKLRDGVVLPFCVDPKEKDGVGAGAAADVPNMVDCGLGGSVVVAVLPNEKVGVAWVVAPVVEPPNSDLVAGVAESLAPSAAGVELPNRVELPVAAPAPAPNRGFEAGVELAPLDPKLKTGVALAAAGAEPKSGLDSAGWDPDPNIKGGLAESLGAPRPNVGAEDSWLVPEPNRGFAADALAAGVAPKRGFGASSGLDAPPNSGLGASSGLGAPNSGFG